jgi:hypothetical protein
MRSPESDLAAAPRNVYTDGWTIVMAVVAVVVEEEEEKGKPALSTAAAPRVGSRREQRAYAVKRWAGRASLRKPRKRNLTGPFAYPGLPRF